MSSHRGTLQGAGRSHLHWPDQPQGQRGGSVLLDGGRHLDGVVQSCRGEAEGGRLAAGAGAEGLHAGGSVDPCSALPCRVWPLLAACVLWAWRMCAVGLAHVCCGPGACGPGACVLWAWRMWAWRMCAVGLAHVCGSAGCGAQQRGAQFRCHAARVLALTRGSADGSEAPLSVHHAGISLHRALHAQVGAQTRVGARSVLHRHVSELQRWDVLVCGCCRAAALLSSFRGCV
jgi:hypothetical protein